MLTKSQGQIIAAGHMLASNTEHRSRAWFTWPDKVFAQDASNSISDTLGRDGHEQFEAPSEILPIESALRDQDVSSICSTTTKGTVGHDNNNSVFLDVEWSRVQTESLSKKFELAGRHHHLPPIPDRIGHQLSDQRRDDKLRRAQGE